ncbi:TOMM precursor leader peptide-binding protein [Streptomyces sp. NPDC002055]|uniref:TOMM precursor leader peptide-binding protein n=1 Tax=Streptomyces sp. NPDC002055 TaxID=3154534 RepID=UPI0033301FF9
MRRKAGSAGTPSSGAAARLDRASVRDRLRPDLASLSVVHPEPGAAVRRMRARAAIRVHVRGAGRVGTAIAAALSASGVGEVEVTDGGCVEPWDVGPSGIPAEAIGERRSIAARRVVRACAPGPRPRRSGSAAAGGTGAGAALVVLAPRDGLAAYAPDPAAAEELMASGTPHLYAGVIEGTGVVGPLVLPGGSACAQCLALARAEQEPAWPRMLAQWRSGRTGAAAVACDTGLATLVAGLTASHALTFLDGRLPVCAGARLEFALPDLTWEPRPVAPHPSCDCGARPAAPAPAAAPGSGEGASAEPAPRGTMTTYRGARRGPGGNPPGECSGVGGAHV